VVVDADLKGPWWRETAGADYIRAEMVRDFIESGEYRKRFVQ
jgi:hypothetical protein